MGVRACAVAVGLAVLGACGGGHPSPQPTEPTTTTDPNPPSTPTTSNPTPFPIAPQPDGYHAVRSGDEPGTLQRYDAKGTLLAEDRSLTAWVIQGVPGTGACSRRSRAGARRCAAIAPTPSRP